MQSISPFTAYVVYLSVLLGLASFGVFRYFRFRSRSGLVLAATAVVAYAAGEAFRDLAPSWLVGLLFLAGCLAAGPRSFRGPA